MSEVKVNKISPRTACGTVTLGDSGDTIAIGAGVTTTGMGRTGTVDWQTSDIKTGTFTAADGEGYFINTTSGGVTVNLPAGAAGTIVSFADYARTWDSNNVTVTPNGSEKIGGVNANASLSTEGQSVTFLYQDSTQGWINIQDSTSAVAGATFITATGGSVPAGTTDGNYKYHKFTGPGTFCVASLSSCAANNVVDYMVAAGGAGGGSGIPNWTQGGGGGAGGYRTFVSTPTTSPKNAPAGVTVTVQGYPIVVGAGGGGGAATGCGNKGVNGSDASGLGITSTGGGGGGTYSPPEFADAGGSGGGGGNACSSPGTPGGAGNTPSQSPPQGNNGGNANRPFAGPSSYQNFAGGGGGANAVGGNGGPTADCGTGGVGGAGEPNYITGSNVTYGGGGGGGGAGVNSSDAPLGPSGGGHGGLGGSGGGGNGATAGRTLNCVTWTPGGAAQSAAVNTASGGGGGASVGDSVTPEFAIAGGGGGSGIVIIRYKFQ